MKFFEELENGLMAAGDARCRPLSGQARGGYILILALGTAEEISVGSLGLFSFSSGFYAYCGSALGGFESRLRRHLRVDKVPKWHIDYLLTEARISRIILYQTERRLECLLAQALRGSFLAIPGFGATDCSCPSHLYFAREEASLMSGILRAADLPGLPRKFSQEIIIGQ